MPSVRKRFQFIDQNEVLAGKESETKSLRLVRQHVMREVRRKKRIAQGIENEVEDRASPKAFAFACLHENRQMISVTPRTEDSSEADRKPTTPPSNQSWRSDFSNSLPASHQKISENFSAKSLELCLNCQRTVDFEKEILSARKTTHVPYTHSSKWLDTSDIKTAHNDVETYRSTLADSFALAGIAVEWGMEPFFHHYFHHFISVFCTTIYPVNPVDVKGLCATTAISSGEASLLNAICFTGALHQIVCRTDTLDMSVLEPESQEARDLQAAMRHKSKTLVAMNSALSDTSRGISDASMITVSLLRGLDGVSGDMDGIRAHGFGLSRMVELRGGMDNIDPGMMADIYTSDTKVCVIDLARPAFPLNKYWSQRFRKLSQIDFAPYSSTLAYLGSRFFDSDLAGPVFSSEMLQIFHYFRHLINYVERIVSKDKRAPMDTYTSGEFLIGETLLLSYPYDYDRLVLTTQNARLEDCSRIAVLLYSNSALWNMPHYFAIKRGLVRCYRHALKQLDFEYCEARYPDLLIWMLFLGAWGSEAQLERTWYVSRLARVVKNSGLQSWEEARLRIRGFLYVDRLFARPWSAIFDEVTLLGED